MSDKIARKYVIRGRVQGVGYRYFVEQTAGGMGIDGYVRNLNDGRVEVYAVGLPEQLSELAGMLWKGPRMAVVRGVDEDEAPVQKIYGFAARH